MDFWIGQLELAQAQIAEIEHKISLRQQKVQELQAQGADPGLHLRLIAVMEDSLARAKIHARYIEDRIAALISEPDRRRRRAAARQSLIRSQMRLA
jgi:hypothetical protein